jgi:hypothetical protein
MLQTPSSSTGLEQTVIELAKVIASGIVGSLLTWLNLRKKLKPEIQAIEASTAKTYAEARHLNGETLGDAYDRIEELFVIADQQRIHLSRLQLDNDKKAMELEFQEGELKWVKGVLDAAGVKLSDYDYLRRKTGVIEK